MKTPITYYGGKQSLIHEILPLIPPHKVYTEVFFGGGTVFFAKAPTFNETINDRLDLVINFYRILKTNFSELKVLIDQSLISRTIHREGLKICQKGSDDKIKLAWAFWYCSNFSYACKIGGGIKYSNDQGSTPAMQMDKRKLHFDQKFVKRIENANIECDDALKVIRSRNVPAAFHYLDPPYWNADQGHYKGYTYDDFVLLLEFLQNECNGKFILSNYKTDILDEYIQRNNWNSKLCPVNLYASRKIGKIKQELIVWNYNIQASLFD